MLEGSILQKLETTHRSGRRPLNFGVYYKNTLVALCHALEDFILESNSKPLTIAAFQQGKWYLQEADRYNELADKSSQVAIMAVPGTGFESHPTSQKSNVALVNLDTSDPVAREWHLMIMSPTYTAMVLCQELSDADYGVQGPPENDRERKFYGFWTFEPELVGEAVKLAITHIKGYDPQLAERLSDEKKRIAAAAGTIPREDLSSVVLRVVRYLQESQDNLSQSQQVSSSTTPHQEQALDDNLLSNELQAFLRMAQLIDRADPKNPNAAAEVTGLAEVMGQLLDLPAWQLKRLRLAAMLHRLAPLQGVKVRVPPKSVAQKEAILQAPSLPKASVMRIMPRLQAVAYIITHQSEHWNGSGKPDALAYDSIPLESRMLALIAQFQQRLTTYKSQGEEDALAKALADCQAQSGEVFDPKLVEVLALLVMGMQQGMSVQAKSPKIASGMWLIDPYEEAQGTAASTEAELTKES